MSLAFYKMEPDRPLDTQLPQKVERAFNEHAEQLTALGCTKLGHSTSKFTSGHRFCRVELVVDNDGLRKNVSPLYEVFADLAKELSTTESGLSFLPGAGSFLNAPNHFRVYILGTLPPDRSPN